MEDTPAARRKGVAPANKGELSMKTYLVWLSAELYKYVMGEQVNL